MRTVKGCSLLLLMVAGFGAQSSLAQSYPTKPIRVVTSGAGGGQDTVARLVSGELSSSIGQQIIVDNRNSATIAPTVAKAAPDGYTLMSWGNSLWLTPLLEEVPWDVREFAPIATLTRAPLMLVVTPSLQAKSLPELIKLAKAQPGTLNYSAGSPGSAANLAATLFKNLSSTDIVRISYKEQAAETNDLMAGRVHMTFGSAGVWAGNIKAGKVRVLASGGSKRSTVFPDLPAINETLPGFAAEAPVALFAPLKTPESIVRRLNQETVKVLTSAAFNDKATKLGLDPIGGSPEELAAYIKSDVERVNKILPTIKAQN